ncbi:MAG TPA: FtsQ-type POTRA domain-containing protein [Candidatus Andersenbacteria bacterium]|nr:FtsQ-type POTRA domain-containing protein [Candidatus Andersenbacteria bacterium]
MNRARWGQAQRNIVQWSSIVFLLLIIIVPFCILVWLLFFTQTFAVSAITTVDAKPSTQESIQTIMKDSSGKNILVIPTDQLEQKILHDVPQVRDVHIVRKLPGTLKVIVQEKKPALLLISGGSYYFVDTEGIAYENASLDVLPGVVLSTVKNSDPDAIVKLGANAVESSFVAFITEAQEKLPEITGAQIAEMRIPSLATREVHFLLDKNWRILMDTTRSAADQMGILSRLLEDTITPEELQTLEYIDLRIPNRVYYK